MTTPSISKYTPAELRARVTDLLASGPRRTFDIVEALFPGKGPITPEGPPTSEYSRISSLLRTMRDQRILDKVDKKDRSSPWALRAKPATGDLPDSPDDLIPTRVAKDGSRRGRRPGSKNGITQREKGVVNTTLIQYLIREIRMKFDELERLL